MNDVTRILNAIEQGDAQAAEQLLPLVYEELRSLAAQKLAHEKPGQTLPATALVHEAYLRLVDVAKVQQWNSRGHFFAAAAGKGDVQNTVIVYCRHDNLAAKLRPGMTGYARIDTGRRSIGTILLDRMLRFVRTEIWW